MSITFRRWLSILLAVWLPFQTAAVLAMPMNDAADSAPGVAMHDHSAHHGSTNSPDDNAGGTSSGGAMDCELCGLCAQIHGGVLVSTFAQAISPMLAGLRPTLNHRVPSRVSDIPHRPPIVFRA